MSYRNETVQKFVSDLASRTPTPGGGSASALGASIGAALASMAAVFTSGEKYKAVEAQAAELDRSFAALRQKFLDLMDADIEAYGAYSAARALPKNTPEEKAKRSAAMASANQQSTDVPERIVAAAVEGLALVEKLSGVTNPNLAGDVAVAAYFLEAAARGAAIQVLSNCAAADTEGKNAARREAAAANIAQCQAARERVDAAVKRLLKL
jgi:methenyltetrahydrofolate cyclohydrolase